MRILKIMVPVLAALLTALPSPAEEPPAQPAPAPKIEIAGTEIDIGQVVRGETAEGSFVVRNTGDAELKIQRVKPG
jgi:hypothetical protein